MKKKARNLILMLVALLVVAGVAALLLLTQPKEEESTSEVSSTTVNELVNIEAADVKEITIKRAEDTLTLKPKSEEGSVDFVIEGSNAEKVITSDVSTMARSVFIVSATRDLGVMENLEEFGLSGDGEARVTIKTSDGETSYVVGAQPNAAGRYVLMNGNVFISAGISEKIFDRVVDFYDKTVVAVADNVSVGEDGTETAEADLFPSLVLSGSNYPENIEIVEDLSKSMGYSMESPVVADADLNALADVMTALKNITADSIVKEGLTQDELDEYGLADYAARADYELNGEKHSVTVSAPDAENMRYLICDESDILYQVASSKVSTWADAKAMNLRSSYIWLPNIQSVEKLTVDVGGKESVFDVTRTENAEKSTEDEKHYDLTIKSGGLDIDYGVYQPFYKNLISMSVLSMDPVDYENSKADITVSYGLFDTAEVDKVSFYALGEQDRYAVEVNGVYSGVVKKTLVSDMLAMLEKTIANETS